MAATPSSGPTGSVPNTETKERERKDEVASISEPEDEPIGLGGSVVVVDSLALLTIPSFCACAEVLLANILRQMGHSPPLRPMALDPSNGLPILNAPLLFGSRERTDRTQVFRERLAQWERLLNVDAMRDVNSLPTLPISYRLLAALARDRDDMLLLDRDFKDTGSRNFFCALCLHRIIDPGARRGAHVIPNSVQLFCMGTSVVFDRGDVAVPLRKQNNRLDVPVTFRVTCGACDQKFSNGGEKDFASVYTACAREDGQLGQARSIPGVTMVYFVASVLWRSLVVSHELIDAPDDHGAFRFILAWRPLLLDKQRLVSDAILRQFPILYTVTPPGGVDMLLDHDRTVISMARFRQLAAQIARSVRLNDQRYADRARQLLSYPGVHMLLASPRHGLSGNVCFVSFYRFVFLVDLSNAQMPAGDDVRALTLNNPFTDFQSRPMAVNRLVSMLAGANDSAVAPFDESSHDEWRDSGLDCISSDRLEQFHCPNSLLDDLSEDLYLRFCRCGPIECRTVCSPQGTPGLSPLTQAYIAEYRLRDQKIQACASFVDVISVVEPAYMYCLKADIIPNSVQIRPASAQLRRVHLVHAVTRAVVEVQSSTNATSLMFGCVMLAHSCHLLGDDLRAAGADHVSVPFRYCTKLVCDSLRRSTGQMICCRASPSLIGADCWPGFPRRTELSGLLKDVLLACNLLDVRFTAFRPARQRAVRPA